MTLPSDDQLAYRPSRVRKLNSPSPAEARVPPLGLNLTTLTAAVCFESVARYSARGGCGVRSWPVNAACADADDDGILG